MTDTTKTPTRRFTAGRIAALLALVCLGAAGYAAYDAYTFMTRPASGEPRDVIIDIQAGATFDRVAWDLRKAGALRDVPRFRILAKLRGKLGAVQAGEFTVNTGWTPGKVLDQITLGKPNLYRLALREGLPWWDVARLVEEGGFAKASEFEAVIHDPAFLAQYGIPFSSAEGFLYPDTYLLRKPRDPGGRAQAETVARALVETFWKRVWPLLEAHAKANGGPGTAETPILLPDFYLRDGLPQRLPPLAPQAPVQTQADARPSGDSTAVRAPVARPAVQAPVSAETLRYLVILASLTEKETGVPDERARVAGVYANRLRIGMPLQCDPTIIYGLGKNQKGPIRRSQLDDETNPYNTYKHPGLPPGPICSPGAACIRAAVEPEQHKYFYFVATGRPDGSHTFSANVQDHNSAVRAFRKTQDR